MGPMNSDEKDRLRQAQMDLATALLLIRADGKVKEDHLRALLVDSRRWEPVRMFLEKEGLVTVTHDSLLLTKRGEVAAEGARKALAKDVARSDAKAANAKAQASPKGRGGPTVQECWPLGSVWKVRLGKRKGTEGVVVRYVDNRDNKPDASGPALLFLDGKVVEFPGQSTAALEEA